ncbi:hypothetical protein L3X38_010743 [Prunus dulcis]|uniref:Uncharacterized protein n=1 Tax=Prunus dulcis TaxID=3755 RepID=A0AAD4WIB6_PRUDU|nr:hypothetical protein L3X38_010743 [Prunus dulcis]
MRFASSAEKEPNSSTIFDEERKSSHAIEMQSYIGVLASTKVHLVDKKWTELPKDSKEQIWEVVQMAYVVGQEGKKLALSSVAKKMKNFKSTLTRQLILLLTNDKEKLKQPPKLYPFIENLD